MSPVKILKPIESFEEVPVSGRMDSSAEMTRLYGESQE
jgi:hypothetical protein